MIPERLLLILALAAITTLAVIAVRTWHARRMRELHHLPLLSHLGVAPDERPTLVSFSTPSCAACHQAQAPAVKAVDARVAVRHVAVDAAAQPEVASAFGVLTVPSTAILTPTGHLVAVNQGFAPTAKLVEQLRSC